MAGFQWLSRGLPLDASVVHVKVRLWAVTGASRWLSLSVQAQVGPHPPHVCVPWPEAPDLSMPVLCLDLKPGGAQGP